MKNAELLGVSVPSREKNETVAKAEESESKPETKAEEKTEEQGKEEKEA